jgi:hypothetical protein
VIDRLGFIWICLCFHLGVSLLRVIRTYKRGIFALMALSALVRLLWIVRIL